MVSNHDELMCNFFAQADALATGKTPIELRAGYTVGQILSLYENRIAVQVRMPFV